ncbi:MAG: hypothetical protein ACLGPL_04670 [Acidobacteriota bacterium]
MGDLPKSYTVVKKGSSIQHCIEIPEDFVDKDLEITIRPIRPKAKFTERLEHLLKQYEGVNPFEGIEDPVKWQREQRGEW